MKVIATAKGYFGQVRDVGAEFEVPDDIGKSTWFKPVKAEPVDKNQKHGKGHKPDAEDAGPI